MDIAAILKWFDDHGVGMQGLGTIIAGLAGVVTIILTIRNSKNPTTPAGLIVPSTLSPDRIVGALADRESTDHPTPRQTRPRRSPEKIIADLQAVRSALMPPRLSDTLFPLGLDVISFVPTQYIKIRIHNSKGIVSSGGWFSFLHFALLPAAFIGGLTGSSIIGIISSACGLAYWAYLVFWRGAIATIKFRERKWSVTSVIGGFWGASPTTIQIEREHRSGRWTTYILFGGRMLWEHASSDENEGTSLAQPFVDSLKAALDIPVEVADGILISFKQH